MSEERNGTQGEGELEPAGYEWLDLYPIYNAPDEDSAIHVHSFLVSAGIEARIRSAQVPWLDGVLANVVGYWGQVLVPRRDVIVARDLLEELQAQIEGESRPDDEDSMGGEEAPE